MIGRWGTVCFGDDGRGLIVSLLQRILVVNPSWRGGILLGGERDVIRYGSTGLGVLKDAGWRMVRVYFFVVWAVAALIFGVGAAVAQDGEPVDETQRTPSAGEELPDYWARLRDKPPSYVRQICGTAPERDCLAALDLDPLPRDVMRAIRFEVTQVLARQVFAWNSGDVEGFMQGYWNSPDLRFVSGEDITFGYRDALARYQRRYPDRAAMGTLTFSEVVVRPVAYDAALVFGRWGLVREGDPLAGTFYLRFQQIEGDWVIVEDITQ